MSLAQPVSELLEAVNRPLEDAHAMPPAVYTSPDFLACELESIFSREWICVGRSSGLPNVGDYLTYDLAGQPIVVLRGKDGQIRAFSNVCLHRMSTLVDGCGNKRLLVCPYHAWTYDLDGKLRGAPFMTRTTGFCKEDYALPQIRCEEWLGWIYITLDKDRPSLAPALAPLEELIAHYGVENYVECFRETHVWDTNWKVLAENFMESYHLPVCHAATVGGHSKLEEMECPPGLEAFNYHWITKEASLPMGNAHPDNTRLEGRWRKTTALITLYPSHLITLTPGYFWYLSLHPKGAGQVAIVFGGGLAPEFMADPRAEEYVATLKGLLDEVNAEDRGCTEKVFRGLSANAARPGHLSYLERPIYDFMHYIAERTAGFDRSAALAAE
ncbi:(2Fe-2S)-binding protein [Paracoccus versutus]|uniref:Phenylpropionate dioxygenase-like ring-hydroxylating dioxygenase large terminal subunit n=1 Tax=Paracoccus versutus TaxID=34007 RepID=A0AAQ0HIC0_PARVE|nr:SRPBCC family protein [Paracoccus versutus]KGJ07937.1 (2Fe-2S)-binding protein [Paracoccus versutus]REG47654.1 phenylpropionate dioxygenase-like ring-hydroxylating dioxygenase large terminal subunit [Paracoccus versutus]WEJ79815.1 (2Fe-2S)-binding protein [Paracoccus versutus]